MGAQPKVYKLRRTVKATGDSDPRVSPLRREFWGVSPRGARHLLEQQEREFKHLQQQAEGQFALQQAEREALRGELETLKIRLQTARNTVDVLREKLAKERSARAVLAAHVLDRQADEKAAQQAASMNELRLQGVRLSVDMQREHGALRELVTALYRTIEGQDGVPAGLAVAVDENAQVAAARQADADDAPRNIRWYKFLVGKIAGRTLQTAEGEVLVRDGDRITPEMVMAAEHAGLLFELFLPMRLPPSDQDL